MNDFSVLSYVLEGKRMKRREFCFDVVFFLHDALCCLCERFSEQDAASWKRELVFIGALGAFDEEGFLSVADMNKENGEWRLFFGEVGNQMFGSFGKSVGFRGFCEDSLCNEFFEVVGKFVGTCVETLLDFTELERVAVQEEFEDFLFHRQIF